MEGKTGVFCRKLPQLKYNYIIIANIYYDEIVKDVKKSILVNESKLIDWIKLRTNIYYYSEDIWSMFFDNF